MITLRRGRTEVCREVSLAQFRLKACSKCRTGDLYLEQFSDGDQWTCLHCGTCYYVSKDGREGPEPLRFSPSGKLSRAGTHFNLGR